MIQRYDWDEIGLELEKVPLGRYVLYADHLADKEAALNILTEALSDEKADLHRQLADHEAAIKEKDREIARWKAVSPDRCNLEYILALEKNNADLLKKLERSNDDWIKAKGEIEQWRKAKDDAQRNYVDQINDLRAKLAAAEKIIEEIAVDTGNRPGHEKWEYYCERLYNLHLKCRAAQEALKEADHANK